MVENSRNLRHTQSGHSHDSFAQKDRRIATQDRRGCFIQIQWERRARRDRRTRNLQEELKQYQRWKTTSEMAILKYMWAIRNRGLAPSTIKRYVQHIFKCIENVQKYDKEIQRIKHEAVGSFGFEMDVVLRTASHGLGPGYGERS